MCIFASKHPLLKECNGLLLLGFAHRRTFASTGTSKDTAKQQTDNETDRHQNNGGILSHLDNVLKVFRNRFDLFVAAHNLAHLLHLFIQPRRGRRHSFTRELLVSTGRKGRQRINIPPAGITDHGPFSKVDQGRISSNLEATADGLLLCAVHLGQENSVLRRFGFHLLGQFVPNRSELLAVSAYIYF